MQVSCKRSKETWYNVLAGQVYLRMYEIMLHLLCMAIEST